MSHFTVLVTKTNKVNLEEQLAPFDEEREVPIYDKECYCINRIAHNAANDKAAAELDFDIDTVRKQYWALSDEERTNEKWDTLVKPHQELTAKYEKEHPLYGRPNPDCEDCHGAGTYKSQYNPHSKWDWYSIGGRWTGYFKLKPGATGELGELGVGDNKPEYDADIARVRDIDWKKMEQPTATFAVLHDGEWYEKGDMGWWGMVSGEKSSEDWQAQFDKIISSLDSEDEVTVVDVHI